MFSGFTLSVCFGVWYKKRNGLQFKLHQVNLFEHYKFKLNFVYADQLNIQGKRNSKVSSI